MHYLVKILFACLFLTGCVFEAGWPGVACFQELDSAKNFIVQTDQFNPSMYPKVLAEDILQTREKAQGVAYMSIAARGPTDIKNKLGLKTPAESNAFCVQTASDIKRLSPQLKPNK